jgi:hypothetical protein
MFAQESVMDIKKLKAEFEKLKYVEEKLEYLNFDEHLGCYVEKNNGMPVGLAAWVNGALYGFNQAATAQAVPEWISVKDKLPGFNQSVLSCDGFETCVAEYLESCKNEYGVFFEEGFWINGAASIFENVTHWMPLPEAIEAQEQTHD